MFSNVFTSRSRPFPRVSKNPFSRTGSSTLMGVSKYPNLSDHGLSPVPGLRVPSFERGRFPYRVPRSLRTLRLETLPVSRPIPESLSTFPGKRVVPWAPSSPSVPPSKRVVPWVPGVSGCLSPKEDGPVGPRRLLVSFPKGFDFCIGPEALEGPFPLNRGSPKGPVSRRVFRVRGPGVILSGNRQGP